MDLKKVKFGELAAFNVIVEIAQGSNQKYEFDEKSNSLELNFVFKDLYFPFNYGFIAQTLGGDGDALDAIVLSSQIIPSGTMVKCKAVGMLESIDRGEVDNKIIVVPLEDELSQKYEDINDLPPDSLEKWKQFYAEVARQKNKTLILEGLRNKQIALEEIKKSLI